MNQREGGRDEGNDRQTDEEKEAQGSKNPKNPNDTKGVLKRKRWALNTKRRDIRRKTRAKFKKLNIYER